MSAPQGGNDPRAPVTPAAASLERNARLLLQAEHELYKLRDQHRRETRQCEAVLDAAWRLRHVPADTALEDLLRLCVEKLDYDRAVALVADEGGDHALAVAVGFPSAAPCPPLRLARHRLLALLQEPEPARALAAQLGLAQWLVGAAPSSEPPGPVILAGRSHGLAKFMDPLHDSDRRIFGLLLSCAGGHLESQALLARLRGQHHTVTRAHEELRQRMDELFEARRQLEQADRLSLLGAMVQGLARDIETRLRGVDGEVETLGRAIDAIGQAQGAVAALLGERDPSAAAEVVALERRLELRTRRREAARALLDLGARTRLLHELTRDVAALARPPAGGGLVVDLREVVHTSVRIAYTSMPEGAAMTVELADLPRVLGDPDRLAQVVLNLLLNAAQALRLRPAGSAGPGHLRVSTLAREGRAVLVVEDDGPGIPPELHARIFEPYFTTKPPGEGTGLGLHVARRIVEAHRGAITVDSTPGRGARFEVSLPAAADEDG
ncbi:MAG TPA: sensor histidine kinase [Myxococcota bacterium]|nr:sensor histidine kinase [Myxococcota bacterium]